MNKLLEQVKNNIYTYDLIEDKDIIVIGLSGGPDSIFLIHALSALKPVIEKEKGIFTALDMMEILQNSPRNYHLCVAGSGSALEEAKLYAARKNLCNVEFAGYLTGDRKKEILQQADVYVSPTTHGEGLPCALLEAMGTGQLIVTRSVGGIKDFFEQNRMGFATESFSPQVFAEAIENLCSDRQKMDAISQYNRAYAAEHFCASKTAEKIQNMVTAE